MSGPNDGEDKHRETIDSFNGDILRVLGKGPASFGPALPAWAQDRQVQTQLTAEQEEALVKIQRKLRTFKVRAKFTDRQVRQMAVFCNFQVDKTLKLLRRVDARQLNITVNELEEQLTTCTLFPLPNGIVSKKGNIQDFFYMRPSRYFPQKTTAKAIITNLIYVMDSLYERRRNLASHKIGFIANMNDWKMENFAVDYCQQFMFALQGLKAPLRVDLFLIVNPPGWFDRIWVIMKPMLAKSFQKKVHVIPERRLHEFLQPGFEAYVPDELEVGQANVTTLVNDFIAYRDYYENATGERTPHEDQAALLLPPRRVLRKQERDRRTGRQRSSDQTSTTGGSVADSSHRSGSSDYDDDLISFGDDLDEDVTSNTEGGSSMGQNTNATAESIRQAMERFGPAVPPRPMGEAVRRLSPELSGTFFAIREKVDQLKLVYPFSDEQILRIATLQQFDVDKTVQALKRIDARQLNISAEELQPQLATLCLFPLPNGLSAKVNDVQDLFYMRPSRYFPSQTRCRTIISNLIYVMDTLYERHRNRHRKMGFIANMDGWTMENFSVSYCKQFMYALQGKIAPNHVDLFLIVNPPGWFDKIWNIMKPMLAAGFRKKVHMIPQSQLHEYLSDGFEEYLPDEFVGIGKAHVPQMVKDFVIFRKHHERLTSARMPRAEQTALMAPPKRVLRQRARERKKEMKSSQQQDNDYTVNQVDVTNSASDVCSHLSFGASEGEEEDGYMDDLKDEELNEGFDEDEKDKGPNVEHGTTKDDENIGGTSKIIPVKRVHSWSSLQLPGDSTHSHNFGDYTYPLVGDMDAKPSLLTKEDKSESSLGESFSIMD